MTQLRIRSIESSLIPKMHPSLIPHLNLGAQVSGGFRYKLDNAILSLLCEVRVIKIKHVVVIDAPVDGRSRAVVPYGLKQAPRCQMALGNAQITKAMEQFCVDGILVGNCKEFGSRRMLGAS